MTGSVRNHSFDKAQTQETKIGKEVGMCAKHPDAAVAEPAKSIIARLHKLAKAERPLWVR